MTTTMHDGPTYKLPSGLKPFQHELYIHLINWKWQHVTSKPGTALVQGKLREYDAILPDAYKAEQRWPHLYPGIAAELKRHMSKNTFRIHNHFYHMASSQAANLNLFLPVLRHPDAAAILQAVRPDFVSLAKTELDDGYCVEYWGGNTFDGSDSSGEKGLLNDKSRVAGTDADIAIAYHNHAGELCLWLVEHKLTEAEFTSCGGAKSKGRKDGRHDCGGSLADILGNKNRCYYHDVNNYAYWKLTDEHRAVFAGPAPADDCPFKSGLNQLWRNQLLALALAQQGHYKQVSFSVVRHPDNTALDGSLTAFKQLIGDHPSFSTFTSREVVEAAERLGDPGLNEWARWYRELYRI